MMVIEVGPVLAGLLCSAGEWVVAGVIVWLIWRLFKWLSE